MKKIGWKKWREIKEEIDRRHGSMNIVEQIITYGNKMDAIEDAKQIFKDSAVARVSEHSWVIDNLNDLKYLLGVIYYLYREHPFDIVEFSFIWCAEEEEIPEELLEGVESDE